MKQSKFIELLNLYVDQEITAQDAALLEAEISRNPERRKIYQQYCRMHKASTVLFESFRSGQVPSGGTLADAARSVDDKVAHFPGAAPARKANWMIFGGLAAAAAAIAIVFVGREHKAAIGSDSLATAPAVNAVAVNDLKVAKSPSKRLGTQSPAANSYQPVFVARTFDGARLDSADLFDDQKAGSLDWMKQIQLPPLKTLPPTQFVFETKTDLRQDVRTLPAGKPVQGKVEMTAFQFQR